MLRQKRDAGWFGAALLAGTVLLQFGEYFCHDLLDCESIAVVEGGERAGVEELVRQCHGHHAFGESCGDDGGRDGFEEAADHAVVLERDGEPVGVDLGQDRGGVKGLIIGVWTMATSTL